MDPVATLRRLQELSRLARSRPLDEWETAERGELKRALAEWKARGGFLPT